jgi:hypothetical protein
MERENDWGKTKYWKRKIIIFWIQRPRRKSWKKENFYDQLQDILIKIKNDYIVTFV